MTSVCGIYLSVFSKTQGIFTWHLASGSTGLVSPAQLSPLETQKCPRLWEVLSQCFPITQQTRTVGGDRTQSEECLVIWLSVGVGWGGWPGFGCKWESYFTEAGLTRSCLFSLLGMLSPHPSRYPQVSLLTSFRSLLERHLS